MINNFFFTKLAFSPSSYSSFRLKITDSSSPKLNSASFSNTFEQVELYDKVSCKTGDSFYLSTDGYADQDGGPRQKKMMTKFFKEQILKIQDLPLKKQGEYLEEHLNTWKGENAQLDDILVIGFKL